MTDIRAIPDAVQWHEGMLLSPHHFQQADLRTNSLNAYMTLAVSPFGWGVRRLEIDRSALVGGTFSVTELEAIMPDGLLVVHPADTHAPALAVDLKALPPEAAAGRITVHVTVAVRSDLAMRTGELQRFRSVEGPEVVDENTGDNAIPIPRLRPVLSLHCTDSPLRPPSSRFVSLPLAILQPEGQGFTTVPFEPPRLAVEPGTLLYRLSNDLAAELATKAKAWGERLRGAVFRGQANLVGDSIASLRAIVAGMPRLDALLRTALAHPFVVYLALCDIAGDLAVVGGRVALPSLGRYDHADPLTAFEAVRAFVHDALEALRTPHRSVAFDHSAPGRFELALHADHVRGALVVGARMAPGQDAASVNAWFDQALIGTASRIPSMRLNRIDGAPRTAIGTAPELDLVPPPNMLLFRVTADPAFIVAGEVLQISRPAADGMTEPAELQLFLPAAATDKAGTDTRAPATPGNS